MWSVLVHFVVDLEAGILPRIDVVRFGAALVVALEDARALLHRSRDQRLLAQHMTVHITAEFVCGRNVCPQIVLSSCECVSKSPVRICLVTDE